MSWDIAACAICVIIYANCVDVLASRTSKFQERLNVVLIRSPKRVDVAPPEVAGSHNIRATPCEHRPAQSPYDDVCDEPSMATVAVSERMNPNELMVKPNSKLVRLEGLMLYPIARITQQSRQRLTDLVVRNADVLFRGPVDPCPLPGLVEHTQVTSSLK